ncbi:MAG: polysaccharide biosynthesis tyrosine autokinase [Bacteroidaceae bacterium]|nr:polysaccharide biosynthesis tyrosine autokinase [Bacteroidaceae bacterium]
MSDEKKLTLENLEDLLDDEVGGGGGADNRKKLTFQAIFDALILNWHWFLLSLIVFVGGAFIYLHYTEPFYKVSARMLIKDENKRRGNTNQMFAGVQDLGILTNSTGIDNEMEVLRSRVLLREVVKDLKLYTEYRCENGMRNVIAYNHQPVDIDLDPQHLDSLDYNLLEKIQKIEMKMWKEDSVIVLSGKCIDGKKEGEPFIHRILSLPATFKTELGNITVTNNPEQTWIKDATYLATLRPPMAVATVYLSRLTVSPTSKLTTIAELSLTDKNYRRGMDVLRQLTICYNRQANADKNEVALRTEEFINDRMSKINEELGYTEGEIQRFKQQQSVTSISDAAQSVQMSNEFSARLSEARTQVQMLDYMREFVNNPDNKYQIIPSNIGITDAASTTLINTYNKAVQDRNRMLKSASEQAPQVRTITATINELQQSIQTALLQARSSADIRLQGIQSQYAKFQGRISAAPHQERVLNQVGRQQDVKSTIYMLLLQKREENSIELAATADNGKLIDEPLYEGKVSPKKSMVLMGGLCLGLFVPGIILFLLSFLRYKIEGHEDVEQLTSLPIIADVAIATESSKKKAGIVVQADKNNQIDEMFRSMRTNIKFMLKGNQKVICFTSSTPGEGKTFNASNLAVSFALLGKKVILCGLDIRKPALGRLFDVSDHHEGITRLLTLEKVTKEDLFSQIKKSGVNEHLDLLLAGPIPPNPTELLDRENFVDVVKLLRENYDYVIFDTAPVGLVTDTLQIGLQADITVFVCRADYTPKSSLTMINALANEKKMPNPCIVLNGIDMSRRKYGYYYGYGKYAHYGYGRYGYGNYGQYAASHYGNKDDDSIKR